MNEESAPPIYLFSHRIRLRDFKRLVEDRQGPVAPKGIVKIYWDMVRNKEILCWLDPLIENDMGIGVSLPSGRSVKVLSSNRKLEVKQP